VTAMVFGATGLVGREVVRQLCVRGARAIAHVRPDSPRLDEWCGRLAGLGAEVDTTPWDGARLAARLAELRPAQLYLLIGTTRRRARADRIEGNIYEAVDLGLTRLLADAAVAAGAKPRFVYLSSIGASASASSAYLKARGQAEDVVRSSGLPWVIARPSIISGPGRDDARAGERIAGSVADGALALFGALGARKLRARYRSTTPEILAGALVKLALDGAPDRLVDGDDLR
jgi:nucleoside-diphosphate-sugar epimerase